MNRVATGTDGINVNATTTAPINTATTTTLLIMAQWGDSFTPPTISDNRGNAAASFVLLDNRLTVNSPFDGAFPTFVGVWLANNISGGTGHTITAAKNNGFTSVWVLELTPGSSVISFNATYTAGATFTPAQLTTTVPSLLVGFNAHESSVDVSANAVTAGYTIDAKLDDYDFWQGVVASRVANAGTYTFTNTVTVPGGTTFDGYNYLFSINAPTTGRARITKAGNFRVTKNGTTRVYTPT